MDFKKVNIPKQARNQYDYVKSGGSFSYVNGNSSGSSGGDSIPIIGTESEIEPTDNNVYSALKTDSIIEENVTKQLDELNSKIDTKLSKTTSDAANGLITFNKGIIVKNNNPEEELSAAFIEEGDAALNRIAYNTVEVQGETPSGFQYVEEFENYQAISQAEGLKDKLYIDQSESKLYAYNDTTESFYLIAGGGGGDTGHQYNVRIVNNMDSRNITVSRGDKCNLLFTFISQERDSGDEPFEDTGERGLCEISIKNTLYSDYTVVRQYYVNSSVELASEISEHLTAGANSVMIRIAGEITGVTTSALTYTVTLTTLALTADNFRWWVASAGDITIPFMIAGNVSKKLMITISGNDYSRSYEENIGTATYMETPYSYRIPNPGLDGVYNITAYLSNQDETLTTTPLSINTFCILPDSNAKLFLTNNVIGTVKNYSGATFFDYAVYDGDAATTDLVFSIIKDNRVITSSEEGAVTTQARLQFISDLEIETIDSLDFEILVRVGDNSTSQLIPQLTFNVDNSNSYSSTAGAVFYMNPRTRNNQQSNRTRIINEIDGEEIDATWNSFNWGNDGWNIDSDEYRCLKVLAGSNLDISYKPFRTESARRGKTIEIDYLVDNVTVFEESVIRMCTDVENYVGLKITPDYVSFLSQSLKNEVTQGVHTDDGRRIRMTLVIMPTAYGHNNFNLCIIYINGKKNREFTYASNDYFAQDTNIRIGSNAADVNIYGIRIYDFALTSQQVLRNYINWLPSFDDKDNITEENDVFDAMGVDIDFHNTLDQYNVLVYNGVLPSFLDSTRRYGDLEVYFVDNPERNVTLTNMRTEGQGTSSMKYFRWNTRYRQEATSTVIHADGTVTTGGWSMAPGLPPCVRFTAKKNYASSMQSHKMGSVNSVQDIFKQMGMTNDAMETSTHKDARISVYQLPFICFTKNLNEEGEYVYEFQGEFTMGPDKGDAGTFGFDKKTFPRMLAMEGCDNSPLLTLFRVPWNSRVQYNDEEEAFQYNNQNSWEDNAGDIKNIDLWIPAYNLAYQCSNRILPFNGTLDELNANINEHRATGMEYWISKRGDTNRFNVYMYEPEYGMFIGADMGQGTINLKTQLAKYIASNLDVFTDEQLNEIFINARISKFRDEAPDYWDIKDSILHRNWVEFMAGTDQRAKNTYAYRFTEEGKWKWRYDDMDTIFDTDNQGQPLKKYSVEYYDEGIWNGVTSNFWNLLDLAFPEEIKSEMTLFMNALVALSPVKVGDEYGKLYGFFKKYYLDVSQYFPAAVVNADTKWCYEDAKMSTNYVNDTDPMTQALGDHYSAESAWISKRINYMMSKYSYGNFSAHGNDTIIVRAAGDIINYSLTPAIDLYPNIANGTSIVRGARTKAGETVIMGIDLGGSADQQNIIQGASWYSSIGQWHDKNVSGAMTIQGKRLQELNLGHETEPITIAITSLDVKPTCKSLQKINLTRINTLRGNLDLSGCTALREIYAKGTQLSQLILPSGSLQRIEFPDTSQYLSLTNYPLLSYNNVILGDSIVNITDMFITACPLMNPIRILSDVVTAQNYQGSEHSLKRVRLTDFNETFSGNDGMTLLDNLAVLTDGTYVGLDSEGIEIEDSLPVLDGTITVSSNCYEDSVEALRAKFNRLNLIITGGYYIRFKDLNAEKILAAKIGDGKGVTSQRLQTVTRDELKNAFNNDDTVTSFPEFAKCDSVTITPETMFKSAKITNIVLPDNCTIIHGDVSSSGVDTGTFYQSRITTLTVNDKCQRVTNGAFHQHASLKSIDLRNIEILGGATSGYQTDYERGVFMKCTSLNEVKAKNIKTLGLRTFEGCTNITNMDIDFSTIETIKEQAFASSFIPKSEILLPSLKRIENHVFLRATTSLYKVLFGKSTNFIGSGVFDWVNSVRVLIIEAENPPTLSSTLGGEFQNTSSNARIYVPDASVDKYKAATNWNYYSDLIKPISEYVN